MEKFELLDRFELLYPHIEKLAELRRLYIDKDLSSLFKLTNANEELRKAVMEKNLHSIFRLVDEKYDDLRTAIVEDNRHGLFRILGDSHEELRKAMVEQNLHSVFRIFEAMDKTELEDFRKAVVEDNLHGLFRLLGPEYEELRKAVVEKNIHSIFRCMPDVDEDLQKAVTEQNIYSIFRLIGDEDLRKLVTEDNDWKLWPVLERYTDTQFVAAFKNFFINKTEIWDDCFSRGQLQSKAWLIRELKELDPKLGTVFLCAGWYATLSTMLFENDFDIDKVRSFDIDPSCASIAEIFNKPWTMKDWQFKASTADIKDINYSGYTYKTLKSDGSESELYDEPNTIINTSCEHIDNFSEWYDKIPDDKLVILQSNNYFEVEEHVNCSNNIDEFKAQAPCKEYLFTGTLDLGIYKRFMIIGKK